MMFGNLFLSERIRTRLPKLTSLILSCSLLAVVEVRSADLQVGFGDFELNSAGPGPTAAALFRLVNAEGVLVAEAGVGAADLLRTGRIFVQQSSSLNTGLAMANPLDRKAALRLILRNPQGVEVARVDRVDLEPHEHRAKLVSELFAGLPQEFVGSLTFQGLSVDDRIAAVTLRQSTNRHGEPLYSTLPVAEIDEDGLPNPGDQSLLVFPHVGAGQGLSTQLVLISRGQTMSRGRIRFTSSDGKPLVVRSSAGTAAEFPFELPAQGVVFSEFTSPPGVALAVGYARVEVTQGLLPAGTAIFRMQDGDKSISEAGVGAMPMTRKARIFVDSNKTSTGFAVANPGTSSVSITYRLLDSNGSQIQQVSRVLPARNHFAKYAHEIFDLPARFVGLIEMEANQAFVPISLKLTSNSRSESILTTLPVADLLDPRQITRLVFPQIACGISGIGPFSTRLIFIAGDLSSMTSGKLRFWSGLANEWAFGQAPSKFDFAVGAGGVGHIRYEGDPAPLVLERGKQTKSMIGPAGGILTVKNEAGDEIILQIPPHALATSQYITVTALRSPPTDTFANCVFPGVILEPEGLVLREPAELKIMLAAPLRQPEMSAVFLLNSQTQVRAIGNQQHSQQMIGGEIYHFSTYGGAELTLSEAAFWAGALLDPDSMDPAERWKIPLPPLDAALLQFLDDWDSISGAGEHTKMWEKYGGDSRYRELLKGFVEQAILRFLSQPVPTDPCGLYHSYLTQLADVAASILGGDDEVIQLLSARVLQVDEQCVISIAGRWRIESIDPGEKCWAPAVNWEGGSDEEVEPLEVIISQTGSALSAALDDFPGAGKLVGRVHATGNQATPYYFKLSISGSATPDCQAFFQSSGQGEEFGVPACAGNFTCTPVSCNETYRAIGDIAWDGRTIVGMDTWSFTAKVRMNDANNTLITYSCLGAGGLMGQKLVSGSAGSAGSDLSNRLRFNSVDDFWPLKACFEPIFASVFAF